MRHRSSLPRKTRHRYFIYLPPPPPHPTTLSVIFIAPVARCRAIKSVIRSHASAPHPPARPSRHSHRIRCRIATWIGPEMISLFPLAENDASGQLRKEISGRGKSPAQERIYKEKRRSSRARRESASAISASSPRGLFISASPLPHLPLPRAK
jgi:hypothetical protein